MSFPPLLSSRERASFAVISRFISCLVTEQILRAFYVPVNDPSFGVAGLLVVLSTHTISEDVKVFRTFHPDDIYVISPLHHSPVLKDEEILKHGRLVGLVDPLDMLPSIYEFGNVGAEDCNDKFGQSILNYLKPPPWDLSARGSLCRVTDPVALWKRFVETVMISEALHEIIAQEMQSSLIWQTVAYESPPLCPNLYSPAIEWEQSLVAGHPTHPMHRARMLPENGGSLDYDWYHPRIRFVRVPIGHIELLGNFQNISQDLVDQAAKQAGDTTIDHERFVYMPVHELQIQNIVSRFQGVEVLGPHINLPALAQSSIRTVIVPNFPGIALKLAVGVKISSSLRTISHFTANFGPRFSADIVPKLAINSEILSIELETSSAVYRTQETELAKHFTAVIRDEYKVPDGQALIVCAALLETDHANTPRGVAAVQYIFELDTEEKCARFLDTYIRIACEAFLPALIKNGVAFEAHAQNVLARFDIATGELLGFVLRDLGGLRIHPPTLRQSTGVDFQFLRGHCVATDTLEETFPKFYHTFVHNHIQRLIRLLGLHYNGLGWAILRKYMEVAIPRHHPAWDVWINPNSHTVNSKCLMRMRMRDSYRDMIYSPYPNLIQLRPQQGHIVD
ncbi:IucC family-domain-containing protein [Gymnopilus junonius]|uniref:IucC family-domain-containing protein n=1 Tax=Gymnopilus junonius TaxID=109634 RepID=A0A9P5NPX5_GYMJU|nr:IucC family-domain-containing protein [Gymnopilus junonius]